MDIKNSFLADAIASLADLGKKAAEPTFHDVNGRTFLVTGSDYTEVPAATTRKLSRRNWQSPACTSPAA